MPKGHFTRKIKPVIYPVGPSIAYVPLTKGKFACIDLDDAEEIGKFNWFAHLNKGAWYSYRNIPTPAGSQRTLGMHAFLLGISGTEITADHIWPGNGLDNRRANLRLADRFQQAQNRRAHRSNKLGFKGVTYRHGGYEATIWTGSRNVRLGKFTTPEQAHSAYLAESAKRHGEFTVRVC